MKYYGITECRRKFICNWINKSLLRDITEGIFTKFLTMGLNDWCNSFIFSIFFIQFCIILNLYPNTHHFYKSNTAALIMNWIVHGRAQATWIRAQSRRQIGALIQRSREVSQNEGAKINRGLQNIVLTKIRLGKMAGWERGKTQWWSVRIFIIKPLLSPTACLSSPSLKGGIWTPTLMCWKGSSSEHLS